jgi:hypothetical protein
MKVVFLFWGAHFDHDIEKLLVGEARLGGLEHVVHDDGSVLHVLDVGLGLGKVSEDGNGRRVRARSLARRGAFVGE